MRKVTGYFGADKDDAVDSKAVATADRFLGHWAVNTLMPAVVFYVLGRYDEAALGGVLEFMGADMPKYMPTVNLALSAIIAGIETVARAGVGKCREKDLLSKKDDSLVHTPFPGIRPFTRPEAILISMIGSLLQTLNGAFGEYSRKAPVEQVLNEMFTDGLFVLMGQLILGILMAKVLSAAAPKVASVAGRVLGACCTSSARRPIYEPAHSGSDSDSASEETGDDSMATEGDSSGGSSDDDDAGAGKPKADETTRLLGNNK